jgi:hypothetical protein
MPRVPWTGRSLTANTTAGAPPTSWPTEVPLSHVRRSILHAVVPGQMGKESAYGLGLTPHNVDYPYAAASALVADAVPHVTMRR